MKYKTVVMNTKENILGYCLLELAKVHMPFIVQLTC